MQPTGETSQQDQYHWTIDPPTAPTAPAPRKSKSVKTLVVVLIAAVALAAGGWFLAFNWNSRAEAAEDEYRRLESLLDASNSDVSSLEDRQRSLSEEKATLEDERIVLEAQAEALESRAEALDQQRATLSQIALNYNACSTGYSSVIADLTSGNVTQQTQQTIASADQACSRASSLVNSLS